LPITKKWIIEAHKRAKMMQANAMVLERIAPRRGIIAISLMIGVKSM